jgi:hypothetical protein
VTCDIACPALKLWTSPASIRGVGENEIRKFLGKGD